MFLAANVERKNKIPNKMLLFLRKVLFFVICILLAETSGNAETFFKKPVAFWLLSGDLCGRGWEKAVWRSFWKGADDAA